MDNNKLGLDGEKEVKGTLRRIYEAFEQLDAGKLDENFSHSDDLLAFGTDWGEKFAGWESYKNVHEVQFSALKQFKFESRELEVHVDRDVAWAADRPRWKIETKAGEKIENDVRLTAVLRKQEQSRTWLVVQWHVSVGLKSRLHGY